MNHWTTIALIIFPNAEIKVGRLGAGGGGTPIEIKVSGDDPDQLAAISSSIKSKLFSINGTKNIRDDWGPKGKKFVIKIDPFKAQQVGISNQDIAISLQTVLDGFNAGEYREGNNSIPIVMQSATSKTQRFSFFRNIEYLWSKLWKKRPINSSCRNHSSMAIHKN